jgi:hypothetical protein
MDEVDFIFCEWEAQITAAYSVPWWQMCDFEVDKESYSGGKQSDFDLNGPNDQ